jgi:phosphoribosylformimino-5-aminoimidazole carboxamide ribonucleotide (ProFAR) isomerase
MRQLTGYFDESGTHDVAAVSGMAGFVGDKRQWAKFEKRTNKLFARYRVKVFHAVDVRQTKKDFAGWTVDRKIEFRSTLEELMREPSAETH